MVYSFKIHTLLKRDVFFLTASSIIYVTIKVFLRANTREIMVFHLCFKGGSKTSVVMFNA